MGHNAASRKRALEKIRQRREEWLADNGPCRRCDSWHRLEVHHIEPETKISHNVWSWSEEKRKAELAKCEPLCYDCHKQETAEQMRRGRPEHGTTAYRNGCRCEVCRSANWERVKRWRILTFGDTSSHYRQKSL